MITLHAGCMKAPEPAHMQVNIHSRPQLPQTLHLAGLLGYRALIRLGCLDTEDKVVLASRAVDKANRFANRHIHLLFTAQREEASLHREPNTSLRMHSPSELGAALDEYIVNGKLLLPCQSEDFGNAFLYALASGVPLDAINFQPASTPQAPELPRHGEAFLGI